MRDIKDPRVSGSMICITGTEVTPDLKYAKVYYSVMGGDKKEVAKGLRAASGYIRKRVAQALNLRVTPEFSFFLDGSIEHGARIASILNTITFSDEEESGEDKDDEN